MYALEETIHTGSGGVPAFLTKLWTLVEDTNTDKLIHWNNNGTSFFIKNSAKFSKELLPVYFKHNNISSFIRQLNMYGFRKKVGIDQGGLKVDRDSMEFMHSNFCRDNPDGLELIKRKATTGKDEIKHIKSSNEDISLVIQGIHNLKTQQRGITSNLGRIQRENDALWREIASLRQKHFKQQQIVTKLIQYLISIVGSPGNFNSSAKMKRAVPLMLEGNSDSKRFKKGPTIEELFSDDNIIDGLAEENEIQLNESPATISIKPNSNFEEPVEENEAAPDVKPVLTNVLVSPQGDLAEALPVELSEELSAVNSGWKLPAHIELNEQISNMTTEIDALKELLAGQSYQLDSDTIMSFFNPEQSINQSSSDGCFLPVDQNGGAGSSKQILSYPTDTIDLSSLLDESNDEAYAVEEIPLYTSDVLNTPMSETKNISSHDLD